MSLTKQEAQTYYDRLMSEAMKYHASKLTAYEADNFLEPDSFDLQVFIDLVHTLIEPEATGYVPQPESGYNPSETLEEVLSDADETVQYILDKYLYSYDHTNPKHIDRLVNYLVTEEPYNESEKLRDTVRYLLAVK